jgi:hypothetical protein
MMGYEDDHHEIIGSPEDQKAYIYKRIEELEAQLQTAD